MRIQTDGNYDWRLDLYDDVGEVLDENTRSGAIDASCRFTRAMLANLEQAVEHPDMTEELADVLSTPTVEVQYRVETGVTIE